MSTTNSPKKDRTALWLILAVGAILFISVIVYLTSSDDCYTTADGVKHCLSGMQPLQLEWPSFWIFAIGGVVAAAACGYFAYKNEVNVGSSGKTIVLTILAIILLTAPWAKGCTDKVNGGITAPGYTHDSTGVK